MRRVWTAVAILMVLAACTGASAQETGDGLVTLCHHDAENRDSFFTIHVGPSAVAQHLAHGDTRGECPTPPTTAGTGPLIYICEKHPDGLFSVLPIHEDDLPMHLAHGDVYPIPKYGCASIPPTTTTSSTSTTTSTSSTSTTTTGPAGETFGFTALAPVCIKDAPYITITFRNTFPQLAGRTGTLTFFDVTGRQIETRSVVYEPGTTVNLVWPGATVDAQGNATDWPGWKLSPDGRWIEDDSDAILRQGLHLVYEVNPTATGDVTYPPATSACASPENVAVSGAEVASNLPHTL